MAQTPQEINKKRIEQNKKYNAYIPRYLAIPFDEKLKASNQTFTNWLKENMEKYLKK